MRYCEKCNRGYPDDYSICPRCGTNLSDRPAVVDRQSVLRILRGLPGYKIILENRSFQYDGKEVVFDFIVLHETGIFLFQISDSYRILQGSDTLRYWTVQERYGSKAVYQLERPVSLLEKDHYAFDSVLRQHVFTKSFAFLIYPDDCGLEKIVSHRLNQMLTVPRMKDILSSEINHYGNVYSNDDIAKLNRILSSNAKTQESPVPTVNVQTSGHSKLPRIIGVLTVMAVIVAVGFFIIREGKYADSVLPQHSNAVTPIDMQDSVRFTLAPRYGQLFASFNQRDFDAKASRLGFREFIKKSDSSISFTIEKDKQADILSSMCGVFDHDVSRFYNEEDFPHITSIRTDDHIGYTIFVSNYDLSSKEYDFIFELISFGMLNAAVHKTPLNAVEVTILGQAGEHLRSISPDDYINQA